MTDTPNAPAPAGGEAPDLRSTIAAAMEPTKDTTSAPGAAASSDGNAVPSAETASNPTKDERPVADRNRAPDGKFAKADEVKATETKDSKTTDQPVTDQTKAPADKQQGDVSARWSAADKALLAKQTPEVQQLLKNLARQQDAEFTRKSQDLAKQRQGIAELDQVLAPHRERIALNGVTEATYVRQLIAADNALRTNGPEAIKWLAKNYGLDLAKIVQQQPSEPAYVDPQFKGLTDTVEQLKSSMTTIEQAAQQRAFGERMSEVNAFATSGEAPHFEAVKTDLPALVQIIRQREPGLPNRDVLRKAYEQAVWANPETRSLLQEEAETKRLAAIGEKATAAQRAAVSVTGAPGGATNPNSPAPTLREELTRAMARS